MEMRDFERIGFRLTVVERLILDKKDSLAWKESQLENCYDFDKASIEEDIACLKEDIAGLEKAESDLQAYKTLCGILLPSVKHWNGVSGCPTLVLHNDSFDENGDGNDECDIDIGESEFDALKKSLENEDEEKAKWKWIRMD